MEPKSVQQLANTSCWDLRTGDAGAIPRRRKEKGPEEGVKWWCEGGQRIISRDIKLGPACEWP